ncbi:hypothetical protein F4779DRAFT_567730 [Xylariaceae sp. FL0662B]|nr:hypothetical protein F4779DRAFT_567730 [Xylariaceae sp. FL0662B]
MTTEGRNDTIQQRQYYGNNHMNHQNDNTTTKRNNLRPATTRHANQRSSRSSSLATSSDAGPGAGPDDNKRERNRVAASKCRKKQKRAQRELEARARGLSERYGHLRAHKSSLQAETIALKNALLQHGGCGCAPISEYLAQAARKFVRVGGEPGRSGGDGRTVAAVDDG